MTEEAWWLYASGTKENKQKRKNSIEKTLIKTGAPVNGDEVHQRLLQDNPCDDC